MSRQVPQFLQQNNQSAAQRGMQNIDQKQNSLPRSHIMGQQSFNTQMPTNQVKNSTQSFQPKGNLTQRQQLLIGSGQVPLNFQSSINQVNSLMEGGSNSYGNIFHPNSGQAKPQLNQIYHKDQHNPESQTQKFSSRAERAQSPLRQTQLSFAQNSLKGFTSSQEFAYKTLNSKLEQPKQMNAPSSNFKEQELFRELQQKANETSSLRTSLINDTNKSKPRLLDAQSKRNETQFETISDNSDNSDIEVIGQKGKPSGADIYRECVALIDKKDISPEELSKRLEAFENQMNPIYRQSIQQKQSQSPWRAGMQFVNKQAYSSSILSGLQRGNYSNSPALDYQRKYNQPLSASNFNQRQNQQEVQKSIFSSRQFKDRKEQETYDYDAYDDLIFKKKKQPVQALDKQFMKAPSQIRNEKAQSQQQSDQNKAKESYSKFLDDQRKLQEEKERRDQEFKDRASKILNNNQKYKDSDLSLKHSSRLQTFQKYELASSKEAERFQSVNNELQLQELKKIIKMKTLNHPQMKSKQLQVEQLQEEKMRRKEEERKRDEEMKKKKRQQDQDLLDELYGVTKDDQSTKEKGEMSASDLAFFQEYGIDPNQKSNPGQQITTYEQQQDVERKKEDHIRAMQQAMEEERQAQMKKIRFHNRKNADDLIKPILNLEIVQMFSSDDIPEMLPVPLTFEDFEQYRNTWIPLFLYETYSQMISYKGDKQKEQNSALDANGQPARPRYSKKNHFEGFIQKDNEDQNYIYLKLYEKVDNTQEQNGKYIMSILDALKEFDLLFISEEPLGVDEVKKVKNIKELLKLREGKGKMLSIVNKRRKQDKPYIELKIDAELNQEYICLNVRMNDFKRVNVYFFDSLSTTIREFRTIKSCEFFPTANIILNPNKYLCDKSNAPKFQDMTNQQKIMAAYPGTGKTHTIQGILSMLVKSNVRKILVCAPSNAALDEILLRLVRYKLFGILSETQLKEKLLRVGAMDYEPLPEVKKFILEEKIKEELGDQTKDQRGFLKPVFDKQSVVVEKIQCISTINRIISTNQQSQEKLRLNNLLKILFTESDKVSKFYSKSKESQLETLKNLKEGYEKKKAEIDQEIKLHDRPVGTKMNKKEIEQNIISRAQIICTTLSMSVSDKLEQIKNGEIEYLIVDEACQCVELTNLIPFEHDPKKVILVGDYQQLPATTFSENSERTNYSRSLFERFLSCGVNKFMLNIQYRMLPTIREFPSKQFYDEELQDSESVLERVNDKSKLCVCLRDLSPLVQNLVFFDLKYAQESASETSKSNKNEAEFILNLVKSIFDLIVKTCKSFPPHVTTEDQKLKYVLQDLKSRIGVISPYKSQVRMLKDMIYPYLKRINAAYDFIEINTVDAYQGREKDIVIISCVRSSQDRQLGFLNDYRRMNVAITRAKNFLWVVGNSRTLKRNQNWSSFISYSKALKGGFLRFDDMESWEDGKLTSILKDSFQVKAKSQQNMPIKEKKQAIEEEQRRETKQQISNSQEPLTIVKKSEKIKNQDKQITPLKQSNEPNNDVDRKKIVTTTSSQKMDVKEKQAKMEQLRKQIEELKEKKRLQEQMKKLDVKSKDKTITQDEEEFKLQKRTFSKTDQDKMNEQKDLKMQKLKHFKNE